MKARTLSLIRQAIVVGVFWIVAVILAGVPAVPQQNNSPGDCPANMSASCPVNCFPGSTFEHKCCAGIGGGCCQYTISQFYDCVKNVNNSIVSCNQTVSRNCSVPSFLRSKTCNGTTGNCD